MRAKFIVEFSSCSKQQAPYKVVIVSTVQGGRNSINDVSARKASAHQRAIFDVVDQQTGILKHLSVLSVLFDILRFKVKPIVERLSRFEDRLEDEAHRTRFKTLFSNGNSLTSISFDLSPLPFTLLR